MVLQEWRWSGYGKVQSSICHIVRQTHIELSEAALVHSSEELIIARAADILAAGGLVAFPTDTFYALGADALNPAAVRKAFEAKGRAETRPMPLLVAGPEDTLKIARSFSEQAQRLAEKFWPGALTIVLPKRPEVPSEITAGGDGVGVRVPDHVLALRLIRAFGGPVCGTSANSSGGQPHKNAAGVEQELGAKMGLIVQGECGTHSAPSTVIDFTKSPPVIVREGAIGFKDIAAFVPNVVRARA